MDTEIFRWKGFVCDRLGIEGLVLFFKHLPAEPNGIGWDPPLQVGLSAGGHRYEVKEFVRKNRPKDWKKDGYWNETMLYFSIGMNPLQLRYPLNITFTSCQCFELI